MITMINKAEIWFKRLLNNQNYVIKKDQVHAAKIQYSNHCEGIRVEQCGRTVKSIFKH